jgi:hypothetical protein
LSIVCTLLQVAAVSIEQGAAAAAAKLPEVAAGVAREAAAVRDELIPRVSCSLQLLNMRLLVVFAVGFPPKATYNPLRLVYLNGLDSMGWRLQLASLFETVL